MTDVDNRGCVEFGFVVTGDVRRAVALEDRPIDSLWVGGHVTSRNPSPEAMVGLARLSAVTERVQIGTSILLLPLYQPAVVAKQVADIDRATGGRVVLGVGVGGEYPQEFRACQVPLRERGARADEAIPLLRRLWTGENITHRGAHHAMDDVKIHPAPMQQGGPPIVVAGRRAAAMRRAARLGDGWMPYLYSPRRYAESVATIRAMADETGRDLGSFRNYAFVFVNANPDGDAARAEVAQTLGGTYDQDFSAIVDSVAAAGTPHDVAERLKAYVDAGAQHFVFLPATAGNDPEPVIDRLVEEIMPHVRTHAHSMA